MSAANEVAAWNADNPVGTLVAVTKDHGEILETKTRSVAWLLGDHTPVVSVVGIIGGYLLSRVKPINVSERDAARLDVIAILREARAVGCGLGTNRVIDETIAEIERRRLEDAKAAAEVTF